MNSDERGYVTVEHAIGFVAVTLVVGVIVAAAQAGMTGASLCQAVRGCPGRLHRTDRPAGSGLGRLPARILRGDA